MLNLEGKLSNGEAVVGIVGLGYVGLPLAVCFADAGLTVIGFDAQDEKVGMVNRGESYIGDVDGGQLSALVSRGLITATSDQSRLTEADAICICVPTPINKTKDPDLSYVEHVTREISGILRAGQMVVLESTTYPGTTREVMLPILEKSGLKAGKDFYLGHSPERVDPGNTAHCMKNTPKVVGGIDAESTRLIKLLYSKVADTVVPVSSADAAEMTKVFENVFRNVNIALVNELSSLCEHMGISVWEVIRAASTKPYGFMPFFPGPGVGGHCIPVDPYYLASKAREFDFHTRFIELAGEINDRMPYNVVSRTTEIINNHGKSVRGARILMLGATFKRDVADIRESPALKVAELLLEKGAELSYNDPYVPQLKVAGKTLVSVGVDRELLSRSDCVVITTDHSGYDYDEIIKNAPLVFDTRGVTSRFCSKKIVRLGEPGASQE